MSVFLCHRLSLPAHTPQNSTYMYMWWWWISALAAFASRRGAFEMHSPSWTHACKVDAMSIKTTN